MPDPYLPPLNSFVFAPEENAVIALALATDKPWEFVPASAVEVAALKSAKDKILEFHLQRHGWTCCYCRSNLHGAGPYMTDREHILPKANAAYTLLAYTLWNLAAACKRCNMQFKKSGDGFVIDGTNPAALSKSENYLIVHPNFDDWDNHLTRIGVQVGTKHIVKITQKPGCPKAAYTYAFFNLHGLEVDTFDAAQGLKVEQEASAAVAELQRLAALFGQK